MSDERLSNIESKLDKILEIQTTLKVSSAELTIEMRNVKSSGCSKKEDIDKNINKVHSRLSYTQGGIAVLTAIWVWLVND